jgi:hypothetical protein
MFGRGFLGERRWRVAATVAAVFVVGAAVMAIPASAAPAGPVASLTGRAPEGTAAPDWKDDAIRRAFRDVLHRDPSSGELRRYRYRIEEDNWTERDIVRDLRSRDDYRSYSGRSNSDLDRVIKRAYLDVLDRAPDQDGLRLYRRRMLDDGWTEWDVREALRDSPEGRRRRSEYAERLVNRAYEDILHRAPDREGLRLYRNRILDDGWDEQDVREALRKSPERFSNSGSRRGGVSRDEAESIVKRAYQNVLKREADADGMRGFVERVLRDKWTQADVEKALRNSEEYRNMRR